MGLFKTKTEDVWKWAQAGKTEKFVKASRDEDWHVRKAVAEAIGELGQGVDTLCSLLWDGNRDVRSAAIEALRRLGDKRGLETLVKALNNENDVVRQRAAESLGKLGDRSAVEPLIRAMGDTELYVRLAAVWAVGKLGDQRALESLIKALRDANGLMRKTAAEALAGLGESKWKTLIKGEDSDFAGLAKSGDRRVMGPRGCVIKPVLAVWATEETCVACGAVHRLCWPKSEAPSGLTILSYVCPSTRLLVGFDKESKLILVDLCQDYVELKALEKQSRTEFIDFYSEGAASKYPPA
jgi:hypothetical protein